MDELSKDSLTATEEKENADLSNLYDDEVQKSVVSMQKSADEYNDRYHEKPYGAGDIVMDIITFVVYVVVAFGWLLLMLLIVSFVARSSVHLTIDKMLIMSGVFAFFVAIFTAVKKTRKYVRLNDEIRRYKESTKKDN